MKNELSKTHSPPSASTCFLVMGAGSGSAELKLSDKKCWKAIKQNNKQRN